MRIKSLILTLVFFAGTSLANPAFDSEDGCQKGPMAQFGQYLGNWVIQSSALTQDGKTWEERSGANWNFACLGNGVAIQDFWLPFAGGTGTNLRMYNTETESWDIAWASTATPAMSHITAKQQENGKIIMTYVSPKPTPARRITFFPAQKDSWHWLLEISTDNEQSWLAVQRLEATRAP